MTVYFVVCSSLITLCRFLSLLGNAQYIYFWTLLNLCYWLKDWSTKAQLAVSGISSHFVTLPSLFTELLVILIKTNEMEVFVDRHSVSIWCWSFLELIRRVSARVIFTNPTNCLKNILITPSTERLYTTDTRPFKGPSFRYFFKMYFKEAMLMIHLFIDCPIWPEKLYMLVLSL